MDFARGKEEEGGRRPSQGWVGMEKSLNINKYLDMCPNLTYCKRVERISKTANNSKATEMGRVRNRS